MKINSLELENVKRIKAVRLEPTKNGLTIIGGKNGQGKTSVLDAIAWGLGGDRFKPSVPAREGALVPPAIHIELDNGIIVERKGKNSALKVIDRNGNKSGQTLLREFISQLALDLPSFLKATDKEKADTLLQIIGVGDQLHDIDEQIHKLYFQRTEVGRIKERKEKAAADMQTYPGAPEEPISALELIQHQQAILAKNGENQKKRFHLSELVRKQTDLANRINALTSELENAKAQKAAIDQDVKTAGKDVATLQDESTEEIEKNLQQIEMINAQIRKNAEQKKAVEEAEKYGHEYSQLTGEIEGLRADRQALLEGADLPLPGLSVEEGKLLYKGIPWDGMSASEQLKVATAIVRKLNPECGFVLMDKLEQMDIDTLKDFGTWLEKEGLQVIATRVSTGDECSVIIEDGMVKDDAKAEVVTQPNWKAGTF